MEINIKIFQQLLLIIAYYLIIKGDKKEKRKILNQCSIVIEMSKRFAIDLVSEG